MTNCLLPPATLRSPRIVTPPMKPPARIFVVPRAARPPKANTPGESPYPNPMTPGAPYPKTPAAADEPPTTPDRGDGQVEAIDAPFPRPTTPIPRALAPTKPAASASETPFTPATAGIVPELPLVLPRTPVPPSLCSPDTPG